MGILGGVMPSLNLQPKSVLENTQQIPEMSWTVQRPLSEASYTAEPRGEICVDRLLQGEQKYFRKAYPEQEVIKKTLIIADWSALAWDEDKTERVSVLLRELMVQGYKMYVFQGGALLEELPKNGVLTQDIKENLYFATDDEIFEVARREKKLSRDHVHILDYQKLSTLLDGVSLAPQMMHARDYKAVCQKMDALDNILGHHSMPLRSILITSAEDYGDLSIPDGITQEQDFRNALINLNLLETFVSYAKNPRLGFSHHESLTILALNKNDLGDIYINDVLPENFGHILSENFPRLNCLNIPMFKHIERLCTDKALALQALNLSGSDVSNETLKKILFAIPSLKRLGLIACNNFDFKTFHFDGTHNLEIIATNKGQDFFSSPSIWSQFPRLRVLDLSQDIDFYLENDVDLGTIEILILPKHITSKTLSHLLSNARFLKILDLSFFQNISSEIQLSDLPALEELNLESSSIKAKSLQNFLNYAHNLKKLNISGCNDLKEDIDINSLDALEDLTVNAEENNGLNNQTVKTLNTILKNSHSLKRLILTNTHNNHEHIDMIELPNLSCLESLNLLSVASTLEEKHQHLFSQANLVEQISLREFNLTLKFIAGSFPVLKILDISGDILKETLEFFLKNSPTLSRLDLRFSSTLYNTIKMSYLYYLKTLNLAVSNISSENLAEFLLNAPNLNVLDLSACQNIEKTLEIPLLRSLKTLLLKYSSISTEILEKFLLNTPNLITLDISGCPLDKKPFNVPTLPLLKKLVLNFESIDLDTFYELLKKSSNLKRISFQDEDLSFIDFPKKLKSLFKEKGIDIQYNNSRGNSIINTKSIKTDFDNLLNKKKENIENFFKLSKENFGSTAVEDEITFSNPTHDHRQHFDIKKTPDDFIFQYQGKNRTKNQGMIIEKLCQFLTLRKKNTACIPRLQRGICYALSFLFQDKTFEAWQDFINDIARWNGKYNTLTNKLDEHFSLLMDYIFKYQFNPRKTELYLGEYAKTYLLEMEINATRILTNPWHGIALRRISDNNWIIYDPNWIDGGVTITGDGLLNTLKNSLGNLISVVETSIKIYGKISNPDQFLEEGGLLSLVACSNQNILLADLNAHKVFTSEALEGLLIRSVEDIPAWQWAQSHGPLKPFTERLITAFKDRHPYDGQSRLDASYQKNIRNNTHLINEDQQDLLEENLKDLDLDLDLEMPDDISLSVLDDEKIKLLSQYQKQLSTWQRQKGINKKDVITYCQKQMQIDDKNTKRLIECVSNKALQGLQCALQKYAINSHRPIFLVNEPEDLICQAPYIRCDSASTNKGIPCRGPSGALFEFIKNCQDTNSSPVLLINYDHFEANDMIRFNTLLDDDRRVDGVSIPNNMMIIGLINPKKEGCYQGSDFYSRFHQIKTCSLSEEDLQPLIPLTFLTDDIAEGLEDDKTISYINLFHAVDWKARLLGHWVPHENALFFEEGVLREALSSGKGLCIENPPKESDFELFWQQAILTRKIQHPLGILTLPDDIKLSSREGYHWQQLTKRMTFLAEPPEKAILINPYELSKFFRRYVCHDDVLEIQPGFLEENKNKRLSLHVTREISEDAWAECLTMAEYYNIDLEIYAEEHIVLPIYFNRNKPLVTEKQENFWDGKITSTLILQSEDPDTSVAYCLNHLPKNTRVIDISECSPFDLLKSLHGEFNQTTLTFTFSQKESVLMKTLLSGETVILTGNFSPDLADALSSVIIARLSSFAENVQGTLILIPKEANCFSWAKPVQHMISCEMKKELLGIAVNKAEAEIQAIGGEKAIKEMPLTILKTRLAFIRENPDKPYTEAWIGMAHLPSKIELSPLPNTIDEIKEASRLFNESRLKAIESKLEKNPYLFISGLTGVGKTTFVMTHLGKKANIHQNIKAWLADTGTSEKPAILFLDEANLSLSQFSVFEGLFYHPPVLLVEGELYPVSSHHRIIFAGNPLSYGDDRSLASLFMRHGNALIFEPLPLANIYEEVLKPIFENTSLKDRSLSLSKPILEVYRFICELSRDEVLISPRELQSIALSLVASVEYCQEKGIALEEILLLYIDEIATHLVPDQAAFRKKFGIENVPIERSVNKVFTSPDFFIAKSRYPILEQLETIFRIKAFKQSENAQNEFQRYGGLGGLILEGEPGIGKSELIKKFLYLKGYRKKDLSLSTSDIQASNRFYYEIPASMGLDEKKAALISAFHEGSIVVIDEVNSSPMMEQLLNALLMGRDLEGNRPKKAGFFIIGTQNPISMAGRQVQSTALSRRMITATLLPYTKEEMCLILTSTIGISADKANLMVAVYEEQKNRAKTYGLSPVPCFRDLLNLAKQERQKEVRSSAYTNRTLATVMDSHLENSFEQKVYDKLMAVNDIEDFKKLVKQYHGEVLKQQQGSVSSSGTRFFNPSIECSLDNLWLIIKKLAFRKGFDFEEIEKILDDAPIQRHSSRL